MSKNSQRIQLFTYENKALGSEKLTSDFWDLKKSLTGSLLLTGGGDFFKAVR